MSAKIRVLLVDDDPSLRKLVPVHLSQSGFEVATAASGSEALEALRQTDCDVVLLDVRMPGMTGLDVLREIKKLDDAPEVIMLTADMALATGLEGMRQGAYDYLTKPATHDEMEALIRKAEEKRRLVRQNASLRDAVRRPSDGRATALVHRSEVIATLVQQAQTAAALDTTILITGESGTGKDVLARMIHARRTRAASPMISVNCGALPDTLFESEFFGHERGAFTGANTLKRGLIEAADGSTLFLDEIGEMPPQAQVKLLHFLEQGRFRRVGATRDHSADVRTIAATNRRLPEEVNAKRFRADLFYRLNVVSLHVLPLRERRDDIPALTDHFLALYRQRFNRPGLQLSEEARGQLRIYDWPGNVRELKNCLERASALSTDDLIGAAQVAPPKGDVLRAATRESTDDGEPPITLAAAEQQHIVRVLSGMAGNRERAAAVLGISERTLYRKLRKYQTQLPDAAEARSI